MRFREVTIENFGIFTDRQFDFSNTSFQLIHGPNEAGKSTLLQLLRQLLFGFPGGSSPYRFESHSGEMAARAVIELSDERRINFRRRKGRTGVVVGEVEGTAEKINEEHLHGILGNANLDLYQHVFGFSLAELSRGEESLKHANLNEAMFGGSLGSPTNLQEIQKSLVTEAGGLFKGNAKNPAINALLRDIRARNTEIKDASLKPRDFEERRKTLQAAEARVKSLSETREQAARKRSHLQRLTEAIGPWVDLQTVREELEQIVIPDGISAASGSELDQLQHDLRRVKESLAEAERELAETELALGNLELSPEFLKAESQIRSLEKEVSRIKRDTEQIPTLKTESQTAQSEVEQRLSELNPTWDVDYLEQFQSSLAQRERLDELATEHTQLGKSQGELAVQLPDLQRRVAEGQSRLQELESVKPAPEFEEILNRESSYRADISSCDEAIEKQASLSGQLNGLRDRLAPVFNNPDLTDEELEKLPVPLESHLKDFQNRINAAEKALAESESRRRQMADSIQSKRSELAVSSAECQVPDRSQLENQRQRRDVGWQLIRRRYLDESDSADGDIPTANEIADWIRGSSGSLPDIYEHEVAESDQLADDRQAKAEVVATRDRLHAEIDQLNLSLKDTEKECDDFRSDLEQLTGEWHSLLCNFNAKPHPPETILEWQRIYQNWMEVRSELKDSSSRTDRLNEQIAEFEQLLARHSQDVPNSSEIQPSIDQQIAEIRRHLDNVKAAAHEQRQLEKSLPADEKTLTALESKASELQKQLNDWQDQWSQLLTGFSFPPDWSVSIATKVLQGLTDARQKFQESRSLDERADALSREVAGFQQQAVAVCRTVCAELADFPVHDMVNRLSERLGHALNADQEQRSLLRDRQRINQQMESRQSEIDGLSARIAKLLKSAGISSVDEFLEAAKLAQRRDELIAENVALTRDLKRMAGTEDFDSFLDELANADADTLKLQLDEAQQQHKEIEDQRDEALRLETEARHVVDSMDGTSQAAALQLVQESSYAQLGSAVDRYVPLVMAQTLLKRAIDRFEKEHQPAMLTEVGQLLSRMTAGRYMGIRRRLDEAGTMQVEQQDGKLKTPDQLSTGTREQLYLAIRLAYIQHYCRNSEPLPLIMDDILVNFDEQRAINTLKVLFELPESIQVLFLTCHDHMTNLIGRLRPDSTPITLSVV